MKRIKTKHGLHICKYLEIKVYCGGRGGGVALFTETFRFHLAKNILFFDSPSKYLFSLTFVFLILQKGAFFCLHLRKVVNKKNIARIANAVPVTLYSRITVNVEIVVLNC